MTASSRYSQVKELGLEFRKKKIHAGFELNSRGQIISCEKDVDCCIVKAAQGEIEKKKLLLPKLSGFFLKKWRKTYLLESTENWPSFC